MNVDIFLDPLADQEPVVDHLPTVPNEQMRRRAYLRRRLEMQRERQELQAHLYDVLSEGAEEECEDGRNVH